MSKSTAEIRQAFLDFFPRYHFPTLRACGW